MEADDSWTKLCGNSIQHVFLHKSKYFRAGSEQAGLGRVPKRLPVRRPVFIFASYMSFRVRYDPTGPDRVSSGLLRAISGPGQTSCSHKTCQNTHRQSDNHNIMQDQCLSVQYTLIFCDGRCKISIGCHRVHRVRSSGPSGPSGPIRSPFWVVVGSDRQGFLDFAPLSKRTVSPNLLRNVAHTMCCLNT